MRKYCILFGETYPSGTHRLSRIVAGNGPQYVSDYTSLYLYFFAWPLKEMAHARRESRQATPIELGAGVGESIDQEP